MKRSAGSTGVADWPVAILAGGLATRLRPLTETIPKALVEVAGEPFLAHQLELLRLQGFTRAVLCLGYLGEMIEEVFGDGKQFGMQLEYSYDVPHLLGTGGALKCALPLLGGEFVVLYGDSYLPIDYRPVIDAFISAKKRALMVVFQNRDRWDKSNVIFGDDMIKVYDKGGHKREMQHIDYGTGILRSDVLGNWRSDEPFDLAAVYRALAAERQLAGYEVQQRFYEIGSAAGLAELDEALRRRRTPVSLAP